MDGNIPEMSETATTLPNGAAHEFARWLMEKDGNIPQRSHIDTESASEVTHELAGGCGDR